MKQKIMQRKRKPKLCLVSSSGGHWEQLQKLQPLIDKYAGFYVTEKTQFGCEARYLLLQTALKDRFVIPKMMINCILALFIWIREKPDFVITTGTMAAYPFYLLARLTRRKFIFIETFARAKMPTKAGLKMQKHTDLFIVQWKSQKQFYDNAIYGGCLY